MIKLGGNPKTHDKGWLHDSLSKKTKCRAELVTFEIKVRTKKHDDIKSFLEVKITRYDSSKQERKGHQSLLPRLKLLRKGRLHEKNEDYISQVSIHTY
jgi:hypothetical protein